MILANGCNITKSEKFKGVWILSVPTVYMYGKQNQMHNITLKYQFILQRFNLISVPYSGMRLNAGSFYPKELGSIRLI